MAEEGAASQYQVLEELGSMYPYLSALFSNSQILHYHRFGRYR
jgi:hypothetical protein